MLGGSYNAAWGLELHECLDMVDVGDVQVIPANLEKSFDQIADAISYVAERQIFTVVLGGDHSIGYPTVRGLAPFVDGPIGIIHFDRHSDLSESLLDERMHGSPFFHATNLPNVPATNLVQIGIGGWLGAKPGLRVARERRVSVITMDDIEAYGIDRIMEHALDVADITALLGGRVIMEVLATLVYAGKLGRRPPLAPLGPLDLPGAPGPPPPGRSQPMS
jgi:agmatinase